MNTTRMALASLVLALCAAGSARAQDAPIDGHAPLPEASWGKLPAGTPIGQKYYVVGRWESCWGNQITLHKSGVREFFIANEAIRLQLAGNRIPNVPGRPGMLEDKRSTVRLLGHVDRTTEGKLILVVDQVVKLEDDVSRLAAAAQQAGNNVANVAAVAREIEALALKYDDKELRELYSRVKQRELAVRRDALAPSDHRGHAELANEYARVGEKGTAIALYSHVTGQASGELRDYVLTRLKDLGAVQTGRGWMTYEAFKVAEGFIERRGADGGSRWLHKEEAEFEDLRLDEQRVRTSTIVEPRQNSVQHGNNASAGKLERGQTLEEARLAAGQPIHVSHVRAPDSNAAGARSAMWTQWVWADGRRAYFMGSDGPHVAFAVKLAKDEWPKR
jgi:hypothetical protein